MCSTVKSVWMCQLPSRNGQWCLKLFNGFQHKYCLKIRYCKISRCSFSRTKRALWGEPSFLHRSLFFEVFFFFRSILYSHDVASAYASTSKGVLCGAKVSTSNIAIYHNLSILAVTFLCKPHASAQGWRVLARRGMCFFLGVWLPRNCLVCEFERHETWDMNGHEAYGSVRYFGKRIPQIPSCILMFVEYHSTSYSHINFIEFSLQWILPEIFSDLIPWYPEWTWFCWRRFWKVPLGVPAFGESM